MPRVLYQLLLLLLRSQLYLRASLFLVRVFFFFFCICDHIVLTQFCLYEWCIQGVPLVYTLIHKSFQGLESEPMLTLREKLHLLDGSQQGRTCDAVSLRIASPIHYRLNYSGSCQLLIKNSHMMEQTCYIFVTLHKCKQAYAPTHAHAHTHTHTHPQTHYLSLPPSLPTPPLPPPCQLVLLCSMRHFDTAKHHLLLPNVCTTYYVIVYLYLKWTCG